MVCEIFKSTFFIEHLWTTASAFSFSEAATGCALLKKVFLKITENSQETPLVCEIFKNIFFAEQLRTTASSFFLQRYQNGVLPTVFGKPQMNIDYLETLTLVPFRYIISFFGRINFQCMSSLVYTVYCEKQPSE